MAVLPDEVATANHCGSPPRKKRSLSLKQTKLAFSPAERTPGSNMSITLNPADSSKNGHERRSDYLPSRIDSRSDRSLGYTSRSERRSDNQIPRTDNRSSSTWRNESAGGSTVDSFAETVAMSGYVYPETHNLLHSHNMLSIAGEDSPSSDTPPVATLCNLGNTCFLNSILYTLRFAPSFLHNLHHLVKDLAELNIKQQQCKAKSSSLGRNVTAGGRSWSGKDALLLGGALHSSASTSDPALGKSCIQAASEKLHELYEAMHNAELKDSSDPFQPDVFLHALREVNPIFEGNQQHDAHELLGCLLNIIRDTCLQLKKQLENQTEIPNGIGKEEVVRKEKESSPKTSMFPLHTVRKSLKKKIGLGVSLGTKSNSPSVIEPAKTYELSGTVNGTVASGTDVEPLLHSPTLNDKKPAINGDSTNHTNSVAEPVNGTKKMNGNGSLSTLPEGEEMRSGLNFIADDFEGISILQTTCLECECITEMKEAFCEIGVPIPTADDFDIDKTPDVSDLYRRSVVTEEYLLNVNKYWCEHCSRYNEARRNVKYETLPRLLTLQLKRFSSTFGSMVCMSKVNDYMPTPLNLNCFCQQCDRIPEEPPGNGPEPESRKKHTYQLYSVIMHLGATMASGHYVAYVRASDPTIYYRNCDREKRKTASLVSTAGKMGAGQTPNGDKPRKILRGKNFKIFKAKSNTLENVTKNHLMSPYYSNTCRSLECCGARVNRSGNASEEKAEPEPVWLECDDETVRVLTRRQFEEVLAPKQAKTSALTPYLLFYVRDP